MRHSVAGRKLKRTKSHRDALLKNMATSLFEHKRIHTTEAKAKELRSYAEALITKAKTALMREKQNLLPEGHTIDIHSRRIVARSIRNKAVLQELFDAIAPAVESRQGGYTRVIKTGIRRGDAGRTAIIELVDFSAPVDGATSLKRKKQSPKKDKSTAKPAKTITAKPVAEVKEVVETAPNKIVEEVPAEEVIDETVIDETPTEEQA